MNRLFRLVVLASAVLAPLGLRIAPAADPVPSAVPPAPAAVNSAEPVAHRLVGVAGCNAVSCHGGQSLNGGEAKAWLARDTNHLRAYDVLFNEVACNMAKRLNLKNGAHNEARCLACHSSSSASVTNHDKFRKCDDEAQPVVATTQQPSAIHGDRFAIEFGVGCESCHGAAGSWIAKHTTETWKALPKAEKAKWGFRDLTTLSARTETCVACHIGSPTATVDHDLIAAGHPRLAFEMSAFHTLLPKHWNAEKEIQKDPGQELRLWAMGQAASAKAMSDIVGARAQDAVHKSANHLVTDFAEFDCNACHHDLNVNQYGNPTLKSPLGTPRWGSWTVSSAKFSAHGTASADSLKALLELMGKSRLVAPPANDVAAAAQRSSGDLAAYLRTLDSAPYDAAQATQLLSRVIDEKTEWEPNWDAQMQRYLAISASSRALQRLTGKTPFPPTNDSKALIPLRAQLKYRPNHATPPSYDHKKIEEIVTELRTSMTR